MAKINIFYDKRFLSKKGYPVKVAIRVGRSRADIPTGVFVEEQFWNDETDRHVNAKCPLSKIYNDKINKQYADVVSRVFALGDSAINMTAAEIKKAITRQRVKLSDRISFYDEAEKYKASRAGWKTRQAYDYTIGKMKSFFGDKIIGFEDITYNNLRDFEVWLHDNGASVNTVSIHMRNIRAIFNYAVDMEIVKTDVYPFRRMKIHQEQRQKECLSEEQVKALAQYEFKTPALRMARDVFMLSFYLCGINPIDLFNLKPAKDDHVEFVRRKMQTRQSDKVVIALQPEAKKIVKQYRGKEKLLLFAEKYVDYPTWYRFLCKKIVEVKQIMGYDGLTMYWARYSWATIADGIDIPEKTISKALGHADKTLTERAYIAFRWDKVDKANRTVIDHVFNS